MVDIVYNLNIQHKILETNDFLDTEPLDGQFILRKENQTLKTKITNNQIILCTSLNFDLLKNLKCSNENLCWNNYLIWNSGNDGSYTKFDVGIFCNLDFCEFNSLFIPCGNINITLFCGIDYCYIDNKYRLKSETITPYNVSYNNIANTVPVRNKDGCMNVNITGNATTINNMEIKNLGFCAISVYDIPGGPYTVSIPNWANKAEVYVTGGGRGGEKTSNGYMTYIGGASGATAIKLYKFNNTDRNVKVVVANKGKGAYTSGGILVKATSGETSSFSYLDDLTDQITAEGGKTLSGNYNGGIAYGGDININGQGYNTNNSSDRYGKGSYWGSGGQFGYYRVSGNGRAYGSGGGSNQYGYDRGDGCNGVVIIYWYT